MKDERASSFEIDRVSACGRRLRATLMGFALGLSCLVGQTVVAKSLKPLKPPSAKAEALTKAKTAAVPLLNPVPPPAPTPVPKLSYAKDAKASEKPYWKSKPDLLKRMLDDRFITVSVKREDRTDGKIIFTMSGAGDVARDKDASFKLAQDYSKLKEISDHFKAVNFDEKQQKLFIITEALGYQARMLMQLTPVQEDWRSEVQWEVIWGSFRGMKGVIGFERLGPRSTEVSFTGRFEAPELPIPKIIMGFALEVITQKVAQSMRSYLEAHVP
jgi:hypothetical protein